MWVEAPSRELQCKGRVCRGDGARVLLGSVPASCWRLWASVSCLKASRLGTTIPFVFKEATRLLEYGAFDVVKATKTSLLSPSQGVVACRVVRALKRWGPC